MAFVNLGQVIYPVGSIYISTGSTSPANLFGGSWTRIADAYCGPQETQVLLLVNMEVMLSIN